MATTNHNMPLVILCVLVIAVFIWTFGNLDVVVGFQKYRNSKRGLSTLKYQNFMVNTRTQQRKVGNKAAMPIILIWNEPLTGLSIKLKKKLKCHITTNRSLLTESSAVVIEFLGRKEIIAGLPDPTLRKQSQYYILQLRETPAKFYAKHQTCPYLNDPRINGIFNMTMYFRKDADFVHYFGYYEAALVESYDSGLNNLPALMANKSSLAAWAVSNCDHTYGAIKRMEYGKMLLRKGLDVATFGSCFNNNNKKTDRYGFEKYKFYLSFENSLHCPDYVTEKFWKNGIKSGAVPIVYGPTKEDIKAVAPPNSYIHVEDFDTPEELITYIQYLDENDEEYLEFHKWRLAPVEKIRQRLNSRYDVPLEDIPVPSTEFHDLCHQLIHNKIKPKILPNASEWLYGKDKYSDDLCLTPFQRSNNKQLET